MIYAQRVIAQAAPPAIVLVLVVVLVLEKTVLAQNPNNDPLFSFSGRFIIRLI